MSTPDPPIWLIAVQAFEFVLLSIFIAISFIATQAILCHRMFHSNLRLLINAMGLSWFGLTLARLASLIEQFICPEAMGELA
jgi:hypothetical protein